MSIYVGTTWLQQRKLHLIKNKQAKIYRKIRAKFSKQASDRYRTRMNQLTLIFSFCFVRIFLILATIHAGKILIRHEEE